MESLESVDNESHPRPFRCDWTSCTKSFNRKSDLQRHYRIHTNERPYECQFPQCGKSFIQQSALTVHNRTHTGEKPHVCRQAGCGRCFSDSSSLARHRRMHTGKRPYKCTQNGCLKSFCRKTTMVKHQRRTHRHEFCSEDIVEACDTESDIVDSPHTPRVQAGVAWPLQGVSPCGGLGSMHSADIVQNQDEYSIPHGYQRRPSMPPANVVPLDMAPVGQTPGVQGPQDVPGITRIPMYVSEQGNPGIVDMEPDTIPRGYYTSRQPEGGLRVDVSCSVQEMHIGDQQSPGNLSAKSYQSSCFNDDALSAQTTSSATSSFCDAASADEYQPLVQYTQQISHQIDPTQRWMCFPSQEPAHPDVISHIHEESPDLRTRGWADYQPPVEVSTIGHMPIFNSGLYGLYLEPKLDYEDISMQLPSARLESL